MRVISAAALVLTLLALPTYAHHCRHHGCRGHDCYDCPDCDYRSPRGSQSTPAANEATLTGEITEVIYLPGAASVEVALQTGTKTATAKLAPSRFLKDNNISLKEGQKLDLKGFWVDTTDGDLFIVTAITTETGPVTLRTTRGRPRW